MSGVDRMDLLERWWRIRAQNGRTTWLDVDPEAEGMMQGAWHRAEVAGPFVLEAEQPRGAVDTLAALYDAAVKLDELLGPLAEPEYEAWGDAMDRARSLLGGQ